MRTLRAELQIVLLAASLVLPSVRATAQCNFTEFPVTPDRWDAVGPSARTYGGCLPDPEGIGRLFLGSARPDLPELGPGTLGLFFASNPFASASGYELLIHAGTAFADNSVPIDVTFFSGSVQVGGVIASTLAISQSLAISVPTSGFAIDEVHITNRGTNVSTSDCEIDYVGVSQEAVAAAAGLSRGATVTPTNTTVPGFAAPTRTETPADALGTTAAATPTASSSNATGARTGAGACPLTPLSGCRTPEKAEVRLKDTGKGTWLYWKWRRGAQTPRADFGDPVRGSTSYMLCVYDEAAGMPSAVIGATAAPGGECAAGRCWKETGAGFRYLERPGSTQGSLRIALQGTTQPTQPRTCIIVQSRGRQAPPIAPGNSSPLLRQDSNVVVQLVRSDTNTCWEAVYPAAAIKSGARTFTDKLP
jgi:hypothetical protein